MFEALIHQWVAGRIAQPGLESWEAFRQRVKDALNIIRKEHFGGKHLAVLTSGGPIGIAVQECLQAPLRAALEVNWRVRNTSLTTFLFSESRLSLDGFNELPHLASMLELVTFR